VDTQYFVHPSAYIDLPCEIGAGTKIWHFCHIMPHVKIGQRCSLGQNVHLASQVVIGDNVKIQNNVSLYEGCVIEDDVFLGPSCVFTNISNPRSEIVRRNLYETTQVGRGATIGANATIVCGHRIGRFAFIAAGSVVTKDVPDYALMMGVPARRVGWMSRHGYRLSEPDGKGVCKCPETGLRYREEGGQLRCLDAKEDGPLPKKAAA
jgi:UDP-2-acetamido-3-amino-2,3-dideoxy-glucuronate N-acetyltransferase